MREIYLVEVQICPGDKRFEPICIKSTFESAYNLVLLFGKGLSTKMILDKGYREGIGVCEHWHIPEPQEDEDEEN